MAVKETIREGSKKEEIGVSERRAAEKKGELSRRGWIGRFREIGG